MQPKNRLATCLTLALLGIAGLMHRPVEASAKTLVPQLVWIDTDIADDIDDAFALGLILNSPELKVVGVSTAFGDTELRARFVDRFLASTGHQDIVVTAGIHTETDNPMTQAPYARQFPAARHADGVQAMLAAARKQPGQITLLAIGPLFNLGAAIDKDPAAFRQFKRVVMMGGSIVRGYDGPDGKLEPASAEWNINRDPGDAEKVFRGGVPIFMMPLDATQIHLLAPEREGLFAFGSPVTDQLTLAYHQWAAHSGSPAPNPTLFDPVAAAYIFKPELCPTQPMRIEVDEKGFTRRMDGPPNAEVCLRSDESAFLALLRDRLQAEARQQRH